MWKAVESAFRGIEIFFEVMALDLASFLRENEIRSWFKAYPEAEYSSAFLDEDRKSFFIVIGWLKREVRKKIGKFNLEISTGLWKSLLTGLLNVLRTRMLVVERHWIR